MTSCLVFIGMSLAEGLRSSISRGMDTNKKERKVVHGQFLPISVAVLLPKFGSQC